MIEARRYEMLCIKRANQAANLAYRMWDFEAGTPLNKKDVVVLREVLKPLGRKHIAGIEFEFSTSRMKQQPTIDFKTLLHGEPISSPSDLEQFLVKLGNLYLKDAEQLANKKRVFRFN